MTRLKEQLPYLLFLLVVLVVTFVVAELLLFPRLDQYRLPRATLLMGFSAAPNSQIDDVVISSMGFAGDRIRREKTPGTLRVLTLGGSAFFNRRMADRLKTSFEEASGRGIELVGGALRAHTSMSSVLKYELLREYDFDLVILYHGINDLWANHVEPEKFEEDYGHLGVNYVRGPFLDRSLILRSIYGRFFYDRKIPYHLPKRRAENAAQFASERTLRRNFETLLEATRADGATPVLMTFASSIPPHYSWAKFRRGRVGYNNPTNYDRFGARLWGSPEYVREGLERHNRLIRELAHEHDVALLDQATLMGKDLHWYGDVCHLSEEGTVRFVRNLTRFLKLRGYLDWFPSEEVGHSGDLD